MGEVEEGEGEVEEEEEEEVDRHLGELLIKNWFLGQGQRLWGQMRKPNAVWGQTGVQRAGPEAAPGW